MGIGSLLLIMNPGFLLLKKDDGLSDHEQEVTCMLLFDSLKCHPKQEIARNIRTWLNDRAGVNIASNVDMITPEVPKQKNGYDCGFYVMKYFLGIYQLIDTGKSFFVQDMKDRFKQSITESTYFQFDDKSVLRMRTQLNDLILILANLFQKLNKPSDQSESFRKKTLKIKVEPRDNLEDNDTSKKVTKEESAST